MEQIRLTTNELAAYVVAINIVLGILFGSFPLIIGLKMHNRSYALYGFISSVIGGAILGVILSYPISFIFAWLIMRNPKETIEAIQENSDAVENAEAVRENSDVSEIKNSESR